MCLLQQDIPPPRQKNIKKSTAHMFLVHLPRPNPADHPPTNTPLKTYECPLKRD